MVRLTSQSQASLPVKGLCDDCDAVYINGALCHEHGCPTASREKREARQAEFDDDENNENDWENP